MVESHASVCVCVCVCVSRYRRRHTDRELSPSACTDVYLGMGGGVDPTHTHVRSFFVPSVGTPWSGWVGSKGDSLVECSEGIAGLFSLGMWFLSLGGPRG